MIESATELEHLRKIVRLHDVEYEVHEHEDVVTVTDQAERVKNGFDLELSGVHDHGHSSLTPGCERCMATYSDLRKIAEWLIPRERRDSDYRIESFDQSLYAARSSGGRVEVLLRLRIQHRQGWSDPIDECERRCLAEMEDKLRRLGAKRR